MTSDIMFMMFGLFISEEKSSPPGPAAAGEGS